MEIQRYDSFSVPSHFGPLFEHVNKTAFIQYVPTNTLIFITAICEFVRFIYPFSSRLSYCRWDNRVIMTAPVQVNYVWELSSLRRLDVILVKTMVGDFCLLRCYNYLNTDIAVIDLTYSMW